MEQATTVVAQRLAYAEPEARRHPVRFRVIGSVSVALGCAGLAVNVLVAGAMANQLFKNWGGVKGVVRKPFIEPWLMVTGAEAALSGLLAVYLIVAGALTLRRPGRGAGLHRWYAWVKLPLACVFGVCAGWWMTFHVSREPRVVVAGGVLALIVSAAYPLFLLRMFPSRGRALPYEVCGESPHPDPLP